MMVESVDDTIEEGFFDDMDITKGGSTSIIMSNEIKEEFRSANIDGEIPEGFMEPRPEYPKDQDDGPE
jgi:hypothetical protein